MSVILSYIQTQPLLEARKRGQVLVENSLDAGVAYAKGKGGFDDHLAALARLEQWLRLDVGEKHRHRGTFSRKLKKATTQRPRFFSTDFTVYTIHECLAPAADAPGDSSPAPPSYRGAGAGAPGSSEQPPGHLFQASHRGQSD